MTEVAKDFEISDRAMAKMCARKQVPVPRRGYWAKKSAGQNVAQPPLSAFVAKAPKEKKQEAPPPQPPAKKPKLRSMLDKRAQTIKKGLKELRSALSEGIEYSVRIERWNCDYSLASTRLMIPCVGMTIFLFCTSRPTASIGIWC